MESVYAFTEVEKQFTANHGLTQKFIFRCIKMLWNRVRDMYMMKLVSCYAKRKATMISVTGTIAKSMRYYAGIN